MRGGIDLGGTKIQAVVVDGRSKVLGEHRIPTPKDAGEKGVIRALAEAITAASKAAGVEPSALDGVGVGSPGTVDAEAGTVASARNVISDWEAPVPGRREPRERDRHDRASRPRRARRDDGRVPAGRGQAVQVGPRRLLGHRRRRRPRPERQGLDRPPRGRRDRPHGDQARRRPLPVRPPGLHGGLLRPARDGARGPPPAQGRPQDQALRHHARPRPHAAHERRLGARPRPRRRHGQGSDRACDRGAGSRASPRHATCSTSRRWSSAAGWGRASARSMRSVSRRRCSRTSSSTTTRPASMSRRSETWAARSAPRCSCPPVDQ